MDAVVTDQQAFVLRVVRWLAIVGLALGLLNVLSLAMFAAMQRFPFDSWLFGPGTSRGVSMAVSLLRVTSALLLVVGAVGLLRWKAWSRLTLVIWAGLAITLTMGTNLAYILTGFNFSPTTTQPSLNDQLLMAWSMFTNGIENCLLPILFLWMLYQREVRQLWARQERGGFDVIPMATPAGPDSAGSAA